MDDSLNHGEDFPTYKDIYEKIIHDHFSHSPLEDVNDAQFVKDVAKRFRKAPMVLCSRSIGRWVNRKLREADWTQHLGGPYHPAALRRGDRTTCRFRDAEVVITR